MLTHLGLWLGFGLIHSFQQTSGFFSSVFTGGQNIGDFVLQAASSSLSLFIWSGRPVACRARELLFSADDCVSPFNAKKGSRKCPTNVHTHILVRIKNSLSREKPAPHNNKSLNVSMEDCYREPSLLWKFGVFHSVVFLGFWTQQLETSTNEAAQTSQISTGFKHKTKASV